MNEEQDVAGIDAWVDTWMQVGATDSPRLRELHARLVSNYSEVHRHYHTLQHIRDCFALAEELAQHAHVERLAEVRLALWFHDAIYDTRRADNEELSAAWLVSAAEAQGVRADARSRLFDLVMATRDHGHAGDSDAAFLVDVDLAILGADPKRFAEYEVQIQQEYAWVPENAFRKGRATILTQFLSRSSIYSTSLAKARFEASARRNLQWSISRL